jgi:hypothetical protein
MSDFQALQPFGHCRPDVGFGSKAGLVARWSQGFPAGTTRPLVAIGTITNPGWYLRGAGIFDEDTLPHFISPNGSCGSLAAWMAASRSATILVGTIKPPITR